ncbi:MAG: hypothetical protein R3F36_04460 [Candidatus Competibacteraceae bacterium]
MLTAGWVRCNRPAASEKDPLSAMVTNACKPAISMEMGVVLAMVMDAFILYEL